jgi:hypothetical protein
LRKRPHITGPTEAIKSCEAKEEKNVATVGDNFSLHLVERSAAAELKKARRE